MKTSLKSLRDNMTIISEYSKQSSETDPNDGMFVSLFDIESLKERPIVEYFKFTIRSLAVLKSKNIFALKYDDNAIFLTIRQMDTKKELFLIKQEEPKKGI